MSAALFMVRILNKIPFNVVCVSSHCIVVLIAGINNSPVFAFRALLSTQEECEAHFRVSYEWRMNCTHCRHAHVDQ